MNTHNSINNTICPVCQGHGIKKIVEIETVPIHCNLLWASRKDALNAPMGDICLGFCENCELIYNLSFEPNRMQYTEAYETSLHASPRFQLYAQQLVKRLFEKHGLHGKDIIEIGCGKGEFLSMLCEGGRNRGVGFDTSYEETEGGTHLTFIRDYYSKDYAGYKADLVCCRHVLEHIQSPREFLSQIRDVIGEREKTVMFFEVPNALYTFRDLGVWDIIYEHCSYFSARSLTRAFMGAGFHPLELDEVYGGQFLCIEASASKLNANLRNGWKNNKTDMPDFIAAFPEKYSDKIKEWQHNLQKFADKKKRVVIWGAGSKGVTFLNTLKVNNLIEYVVDINVNKQGKFIAGTGHEIVPPTFLREYQPHAIIVMNSIYSEEIKRITSALDVAADLVAA